MVVRMTVLMFAIRVGVFRLKVDEDKGVVVLLH